MKFSIMSFNMRYNNPQDGMYSWPNRVDAVEALLKEHRPTVLCTQEGLQAMLQQVSNFLPKYSLYGTGRMSDGGDEHVAIFVDTTAFQVISHGQFWLSLEPDVPGSKSWNTIFPRIVTWVVVEERKQKKRLAIFNVHLDNRKEQARLHGGALLRARMPTIAQSHGVDPRAIILCGDFNAPSTAPEVAAFCTDDANLRLQGCDSVTTGTFHGFRGESSEQAIDYILNGPLVTVHEIVVETRQFRDMWPSDHYPVIAQVEI